MDLIGSYQAVWIGHRMFSELQVPFEAKIFGATSRGIFLRGPTDQILFISYEPHPGPLTINLAVTPRTGRLDGSPNQSAWVSPTSIRLQSGAQIRLNGATTWQPGPIPTLRAGRAARTNCLREVASLAGERMGPDSLTILLTHILSLPGPPLPGWQQPFARAWAALADPARPSLLFALPQLEEVLGLGRGLTPSGDDFICGFLLGLNRLAPSEQPPETREISSRLALAARTRTTTLSAALIEAAAAGSADQRLVTAWDGLLSGSLQPAQIFQYLAAYGSSSGIDALAGFAAASALLQD